MPLIGAQIFLPAGSGTASHRQSRGRRHCRSARPWDSCRRLDDAGRRGRRTQVARFRTHSIRSIRVFTLNAATPTFRACCMTFAWLSASPDVSRIEIQRTQDAGRRTFTDAKSHRSGLRDGAPSQLQREWLCLARSRQRINARTTVARRRRNVRHFLSAWEWHGGCPRGVPSTRLRSTQRHESLGVFPAGAANMAPAPKQSRPNAPSRCAPQRASSLDRGSVPSSRSVLLRLCNDARHRSTTRRRGRCALFCLLVSCARAG